MLLLLKHHFCIKFAFSAHSLGVPELASAGEMTGSRRQRGKREGSFLEYVKDSLDEVRAELVSIKKMVIEVNAQSRCLVGALRIMG